MKKTECKLALAGLPSVPPLPPVASEFTGSTIKSWNMERGPHVCSVSLSLLHARRHPMRLYVIIVIILLLHLLCAKHYLL